MKRPATIQARLDALVRRFVRSGLHPIVQCARIARLAYKMGRVDTERRLAPSVNAEKVLRGAAAVLGQVDHAVYRKTFEDAGYRFTDEQWASLTVEQRGEAILVALACTSDVEDPGAAPDWMEQFDALNGPEGTAF